MEMPATPLPEQPVRRNNGPAIAAGWSGIGSVVIFLIGFGVSFAFPGVQSFCLGIGGLACLAGFILGIIGLVQIKRHLDQKGKGWAITGIVIGAFFVCAAPVFAIMLLLGPTVGNVFSGINGTLIAP